MTAKFINEALNYLKNPDFFKKDCPGIAVLLFLLLVFIVQPLFPVYIPGPYHIIPAIAVLSIMVTYLFAYGGLAIALVANSTIAGIVFSRPAAEPEVFIPGLISLLLFSSAGCLVLAYLKNRERLKNNNLEWLSAVDCLTETYNHRYFQVRLAEEMARARRSNSTLSLVFVDLDNFKQYNDQNGHVMGDLALKKTAAFLNEKTRIHDIVCRYGGDEFVIILPDSDAEGAAVISDRLVREFVLRDVPSRNKHSVPLTLSIGVSDYPNFSGSAEELICQADRALYLAKEAGKNNVRIYTEENAGMEAGGGKAFSYNSCENELIKSYRKMIKDLPGPHLIAENFNEENGNGGGNGEKFTDKCLLIGKAIGVGHAKIDPSRLAVCLNDLNLH